MEDAKCAGREFGAHDTSNLPSAQSTSHRREARALCEGCTVIGKCADYALRTKMIGVVVAGVPLRLEHNEHLYAELRSIAQRESSKPTRAL